MYWIYDVENNLDTIFWMGPHKSRGEGKNHLPQDDSCSNPTCPMKQIFNSFYKAVSELHRTVLILQLIYLRIITDFYPFSQYEES